MKREEGNISIFKQTRCRDNQLSVASSAGSTNSRLPLKKHRRCRIQCHRLVTLQWQHLVLHLPEEEAKLLLTHPQTSSFNHRQKRKVDTLCYWRPGMNWNLRRPLKTQLSLLSKQQQSLFDLWPPVLHRRGRSKGRGKGWGCHMHVDKTQHALTSDLYPTYESDEEQFFFLSGGWRL